MFRHLDICFSSPVCNCKTQNLEWGLWADADRAVALFVTCKDCRTSLFIPPSKLVADFKFEVPYPTAPNKNARIITLVQDPKDKK